MPFNRYTPAEVEARYNFPTNDAAGQTVGILGWGHSGALGVDVDALAAYFEGRGLPVPSITVVLVGEQTNGTVSSDELRMDCQIVGTFAQNAAIRVYLALEQPDDIASAIGHFASGDSGAGAVGYPAASPWALAVGGTFVPQSTGVEQVWWNYPSSGSAGRSWWASGGGVAPWQTPSYQQGVAPTSFSCCGATPVEGRGTPDVAALAQGNGYWVGTSACSPFWAALIATINAGLGLQVGFINDVLYGLSSASGALNKISTGNNIPPGTDCTPPSGQFPPCGYTASASGWDACTGLGTPNGQNLMTALGNVLAGKRRATRA